MDGRPLPKRRNVVISRQTFAGVDCFPSIEAALYPANVPYHYFVAYPDGHHEFRANHQGHEIAKAEARRAWNAVEASRRDSTRDK